MDISRAERHRNALNEITKKHAAVQRPEIDFSLHVQEDGSTVSTHERVVKDVQAPAFLTPSDSQFYSAQDPTKPDIAFLKNHFYREGRLTHDQVIYIITTATEILKQEPNVLEVEAPITGIFCFYFFYICKVPFILTLLVVFEVCGDVHGQYVSYVTRLFYIYPNMLL